MADPTLCDQFYQQLEVAIDMISEKRPIIIVMGEMNGKVGKRKVMLKTPFTQSVNPE